METIFGLIGLVVLYFITHWLLESGLFKYIFIFSIVTAFINPVMLGVLVALFIGALLNAVVESHGDEHIPDRGVSSSDLHGD